MMCLCVLSILSLCTSFLALFSFLSRLLPAIILPLKHKLEILENEYLPFFNFIMWHFRLSCALSDYQLQ